MNTGKSIRRTLAITAGGAAVGSTFFGITACGPTHAQTARPRALKAAVAGSAHAGSHRMKACEADDLHIARGPVEAGAGQRHSRLDFRTVNGVTCELTGDLTKFRFLRADGAELPTKASVHGDKNASVVLKPGDTAHLTLSWTVVGDSHFTPQMLSFTVPPGDQEATVRWGAGAVGGSGKLVVGELHR